MGCTTQGEKAAVIKELRDEGYRLKHLLKGINMPKSTYYYEISKVDSVGLRNAELTEEIKKIFIQNKGRYGVRRVHRELLSRGHGGYRESCTLSVYVVRDQKRSILHSRVKLVKLYRT